MKNDHPMSTVFAFTEKEAANVQLMLETLVRSLRIVPGGGKMEEGYWSYIYHAIRKAPIGSWSNLPMRDFCHNGLGVEMKMLQRTAPISDQGHRVMHPAATRTLVFDPSLEAETCKDAILTQFGAQIAAFRNRVALTCPGRSPDIRWGIFLWSPNLDEFLYFEEEIKEPNTNNFYARFVEGSHRGKPTRNLHIFERGTNIKRFSITMPEKGAKLQPYFEVPTMGKGAYIFRIPNDDLKPLWLNDATIKALQEALIKQNKAAKLVRETPATYLYENSEPTIGVSDEEIDKLIISALNALSLQ
jgi:hypothetical protein